MTEGLKDYTAQKSMVCCVIIMIVIMTMMLWWRSTSWSICIDLNKNISHLNQIYIQTTDKWSILSKLSVAQYVQ